MSGTQNITHDGRPRRSLVLTGGGARAAYQAGVLRGIGRQHPNLSVPIVTGISAGAINAVFLAAHQGSFAEATDQLASVWRAVTFDDVFCASLRGLGRAAGRPLLGMLTGGRVSAGTHGLLDTKPLRRFLQRTLGTSNTIDGIARNIASGRLRAASLATLNYRTGENISWAQGNAEIGPWRRAQRQGQLVDALTVEHVMASSALPMIFPAIRLGDDWFGDGGIRLSAPVSPALHLGADGVLAISTRYQRQREEVDNIPLTGYPPPAQIAGKLFNAIFLDVLDRDVRRIERINTVLRKVPPTERNGMRLLDMMLVRPSQNLGRMVSSFEPQLPKALRFVTRGLGTRQASSPDFLSMLMFQDDYLDALLTTGERDADANRDPIAAWVERTSEA